MSAAAWSPGREPLRRAVLACLAAGPRPLDEVVRAVEAALPDASAARGLAACLQGLVRVGEIHLTCDGRRWLVAPVCVSPSSFPSIERP